MVKNMHIYTFYMYYQIAFQKLSNSLFSLIFTHCVLEKLSGLKKQQPHTQIRQCYPLTFVKFQYNINQEGRDAK